MKRFFTALAFCSSLLVVLAFVLFAPVGAKEEPIVKLLDQPAPPPPNPLVKPAVRTDQKFYSKSKPPPDDASIEDLIDYWSYQSGQSTPLNYTPKMSDAVAERLFAELSTDPEQLPNLLNALPPGERTADFVKNLYNREGDEGAFDVDGRGAIKDWLLHNSPDHAPELARLAEKVAVDGEYISNHENLLSLTTVDYDRAKPIIDRLYNDSSHKAPQTLAIWARYRHAIATNATSDIDSYRKELMRIVEDKTATGAVRDLALDAIAREKEWPERDEWYYSLLGDETLADIRVNGQSFTGLTTIMLRSPDEKHIDKMLELLKSDNVHVRSAAVRNLALRLSSDNPEILRALIPWLEDPKWAKDYNNVRSSIIYKFSEVEMPESVPGLIQVLDEKVKVTRSANSANVAVNVAVNTNRANAPRVERLDSMTVVPETTEQTIHRSAAVMALTKQRDSRAAPVLRRILSEASGYERNLLIRGILACNGFSIQEQLDGVESAAKGARFQSDEEAEYSIGANAGYRPDFGSNAMASAANAMANAANAMARAENAASEAARAAAYEAYLESLKKPLSQEQISAIIGSHLTNSSEFVSDELAAAVVDRIETLDKKDPKMAAAYRRLVLNWDNSAIVLLMLRDLKRGMATTDTMLRIISDRAKVREKFSGELTEMRSGRGIPSGFSSCLFEEPADGEQIIAGDDIQAKIGLYACARMIRLALPPAKIAPDLKSANQTLKLAAERYLESEDSAEARSYIHSAFPGEIRVLGARAAFTVEGRPDNPSPMLYTLFQSIGNDGLYQGWYGSRDDDAIIKSGKELVAEMKKDTEMLGLYAFDKHYIRVYKDRALFSWDEDDSRYRERPLSKGEFDAFVDFLRSSNADASPPYVFCGGEYCSGKELLMIGRGGGRRVYFSGSDELAKKRGPYPLLSGLNDIFAQLKRPPATLKYMLSREIPGLEIVSASDDIYAETVWKGGTDDLRIVGSINAVRDKIAKDAKKIAENTDAEKNYEERLRKKREYEDDHAYEGYAWYKVATGGLQPSVQPPTVGYIPDKDSQAVQPAEDRWKARTATIEIRADQTGLYKLVGGRLTKIRPGDYGDPVISPDGRWAVVTKLVENQYAVMRVDLMTGREVAVVTGSYQELYPVAHINALNRILLIPSESDYSYYDYETDPGDGIAADDVDISQMMLVDLAGKTFPVQPDLRPLSQQTFRPLQPSAKPNELWAAIPNSEKNETLVGTFNQRTFAFTQVLRIPKIRFNSMQMWADEPGNKLYFTYRGHLLSMPLAKPLVR